MACRLAEPLQYLQIKTLYTEQTISPFATAVAKGDIVYSDEGRHYLRGRVCAEFAGRAPGETCTGRGRGEERRGE